MCEHDAIENLVDGVLGIVDALVCALVNARIYALDHPRVTDAIGRLGGLVDRELTARRIEHLEIGMAEGFLVVEGRPLAGLSLPARRLTDALERCDSGGVDFRRGIDATAALALLRVLGRSDTRSHSAANAELSAERVVTIRLLPRLAGTAAGVGAGFGLRAAAASRMRADADGRIDVPLQACRSLYDALQDSAVRIATGDPPDWNDARTGVESMLHALRHAPGTALEVARYEHYDAYTFGHSVRVAMLAMHFASRWIQREDRLLDIGCAALLHDIGKVRLPYELLHFRGRLDAEQRLEMQRHAELGAEILAAGDEPSPLAIAVAFGHHRCGPRRYPDTVGSAEPSPVTKLVTICDVYEALTANRPYKRSMSPRAAYWILLHTQGIDRAMLRAFVAAHGLFPDGSHVTLDTGETAVVESQTDRIDRPVVTTALGPEGEPLDPSDRRRIDLRTGVASIVSDGSERSPESASAHPSSTSSPTT